MIRLSMLLDGFSKESIEHFPCGVKTNIRSQMTSLFGVSLERLSRQTLISIVGMKEVDELSSVDHVKLRSS